MNREVENKIKIAFTEINKEMEAHLIESIISLFHQGVLKHYVRSPRQKIDESNFTMSIEAANGVSFEGRQKIIDLENKLAEAVEVLKWIRLAVEEAENYIVMGQELEKIIEYAEFKSIENKGGAR